MAAPFRPWLLLFLAGCSFFTVFETSTLKQKPRPRALGRWLHTYVRVTPPLPIKNSWAHNPLGADLTGRTGRRTAVALGNIWMNTLSSVYGLPQLRHSGWYIYIYIQYINIYIYWIYSPHLNRVTAEISPLVLPGFAHVLFRVSRIFHIFLSFAHFFFVIFRFSRFFFFPQMCECYVLF